jgi:hypothetical protein
MVSRGSNDYEGYFYCYLLYTITYRLGVFHHDLLITELQYIDYKKYTDGTHVSKDMILGYQKI